MMMMKKATSSKPMMFIATASLMMIMLAGTTSPAHAVTCEKMSFNNSCCQIDTSKTPSGVVDLTVVNYKCDCPVWGTSQCTMIAVDMMSGPSSMICKGDKSSGTMESVTTELEGVFKNSWVSKDGKCMGVFLLAGATSTSMEGSMCYENSIEDCRLG